MMRNLLLTICFDGSNYHGWQIQSNAITVQEKLSLAIERVTGVRSSVNGCSRTDSGVHANMFCCNFKTQSTLECKTFINALNAYLPFDIAVTDCIEMPESFHARFDCISKEYKYLIWNEPVRNPFYQNKSLHYKNRLDELMLNCQAKSYIGTYDFASFCASGSKVTSTNRTVFDACVKREGSFIAFTVEADGFLYNMVRIMVGTLLYISEGKIKTDSILSIIEAKNRDFAGFTAPANGLYLNNVNYSLSPTRVV